MFAGGGVITLAGTDLDITEALSISGDIDGDGKADITIDGDALSGIFNFSLSGAASLEALTITNGRDVVGGGVRVNNGDVTITGTTISNTAATTNSGGGILFHWMKR